MDAALIPWRPLGEMLVERGLLDHDVLEELLQFQRESGRRLGEIIVERGLISGPTLAATLAEQCGVELTTESGFGTGLRGEIQRRHEGERERLPQQAEPSTNGSVHAFVEQVSEAGPIGEREETAHVLGANGQSDHEFVGADRLLDETWKQFASSEDSSAESERIGSEPELVERNLWELAPTATEFAEPPEERERELAQHADRVLEQLDAGSRRLDTLLEGTLQRVAAAFTDQGRELAQRQDDLLKGLDERCKRLEELLARHHTRMAELDEVGRKDLQLTLDERVLQAGERNVERLERRLESIEEKIAASPPDDAADAPAEDEQPPVEKLPAEPTEHLLLFPDESGYSLVQRTGAPPPVGAHVELSGERSFVVAKLGPSPLPRDTRSCSHLERTSVREQVATPAASPGRVAAVADGRLREAVAQLEDEPGA